MHKRPKIVTYRTMMIFCQKIAVRTCSININGAYAISSNYRYFPRIFSYPKTFVESIVSYVFHEHNILVPPLELWKIKFRRNDSESSVHRNTFHQKQKHGKYLYMLINACFYFRHNIIFYPFSFRYIFFEIIDVIYSQYHIHTTSIPFVAFIKLEKPDI